MVGTAPAGWGPQGVTPEAPIQAVWTPGRKAQGKATPPLSTICPLPAPLHVPSAGTVPVLGVAAARDAPCLVSPCPWCHPVPWPRQSSSPGHPDPREQQQQPVSFENKLSRSQEEPRLLLETLISTRKNKQSRKAAALRGGRGAARLPGLSLRFSCLPCT